MHRGEESKRDARKDSEHEREREQTCVEHTIENGAICREDGEHGAHRQLADDESASAAKYPSSVASVSSSRTTRDVPAPRDRRTDISAARVVTCASRMFATFAQAIASTNPVTANSRTNTFWIARRLPFAPRAPS